MLTHPYRRTLTHAYTHAHSRTQTHAHTLLTLSHPLQAFDTGDAVLFFSLWKSFLAPEARAHPQVSE